MEFVRRIGGENAVRQMLAPLLHPQEGLAGTKQVPLRRPRLPGPPTIAPQWYRVSHRISEGSKKHNLTAVADSLAAVQHESVLLLGSQPISVKLELLARCRYRDLAAVFEPNDDELTSKRIRQLVRRGFSERFSRPGFRLFSRPRRNNKMRIIVPSVLLTTFWIASKWQVK